MQSVVAQELEAFEQCFDASVRAQGGTTDQILRYILRRKGKRIRPLLVLLSAKVFGPVSERTYRAATLVELLHTATLLHDDVVDEADRRRGILSVNALWGNRAAVLVGDYMLSRGLILATTHGDTDILEILSRAVQRMSEGELLQLKRVRRMSVDEPTYFRIIADKTASLLSACTESGAVSAGAEAADRSRMAAFGEQLGLAFQIRDDLFDYGTAAVGKPVGADLGKSLVTLPLVYALRNSPVQERRRALRLLRQRRKSHTPALRQFADIHGGLAYAHQRMEGHVREAQALLASFPASEARDTLLSLSRFVIARTR